MRITLYHRAYDSNTRMDTWTAADYEATVHSDNRISGDTNGEREASVHKLRIFTDENINISMNDRVALGGSDNLSPPDSSVTVISFSDNRKSGLSKMVSHWRVECV